MVFQLKVMSFFFNILHKLCQLCTLHTSEVFLLPMYTPWTNEPSAIHVFKFYENKVYILIALLCDD